MGSAQPVTMDALIVGAGFSGIYLLHKLRNSGLNVKVYEMAESFGGIWYWNCYPGARVDSDCQIYQFPNKFHPDIWRNWEWKQLYPNRDELCEYFKYVDATLELSKDINFNTRVISAQFDANRNQWLVKTEGRNGSQEAWTKFLFLATGFGSKSYTPNFKGLDKFKGECHHTSAWPQNGTDLTGKNVAVIGTGASGVQVIQEIGPIANHLTIYQRTPNLALPMKQSSDPKVIRLPETAQLEVFDLLPKTFGGFPLAFDERSALSVTPAERKELYEMRYTMGGFGSWVGTFNDVLFVQEANDTAYEFWAEKTRARITNPIKKDLLAPLVPQHPFGTKRPSLEVNYYEVCDRDNVDIIDVRKSPILEVTEDGIKTEKEGVVPVDAIVLATGFDCYTGVLDIDIKNEKGVSLKENWKDRVRSYLGMTVAGFPNMFYTYGPQAPTAFLNGPTSSETQGEWLNQLMNKMKNGQHHRVEPTVEAEEKWIKTIDDLWTNSLFPKADSWYCGANIPGKKRQAYNFVGGLPMYIEALERCVENNYDGFIIH